MGNYKKKYENYEFWINWTDSKPYNPKKQEIEVRLKTKDNEEYSANFTTSPFINYMFKKNKKTGECASGTYFCMPGMIIVKEINNKMIKKTIDDLIENLEVEEYFKKIN